MNQLLIDICTCFLGDGHLLDNFREQISARRCTITRCSLFRGTDCWSWNETRRQRASASLSSRGGKQVSDKVMVSGSEDLLDLDLKKFQNFLGFVVNDMILSHS